MLPPHSSRSVDPRLAAASGVLRDTVGAIHNLQHLLSSPKVGPKALARVIPDLRTACGPARSAAEELVEASGGAAAPLSIRELGELLSRRMADLAVALDAAKRLRASERLTLEQAMAGAVRDLDGALELVDLLVEASAPSGVSLDATDVIRESAARPDTGSGRGRKVTLEFRGAPEPILVRVNPRLAMRLFTVAVALVTRREGSAVVTLTSDARECRMEIAAGPAARETFIVSVPPLIPLSGRFAEDTAESVSARLELPPGELRAMLAFPLEPPE